MSGYCAVQARQVADDLRAGRPGRPSSAGRGIRASTTGRGPGLVGRASAHRRAASGRAARRSARRASQAFEASGSPCRIDQAANASGSPSAAIRAGPAACRRSCRGRSRPRDGRPASASLSSGDQRRAPPSRSPRMPDSARPGAGPRRRGRSGASRIARRGRSAVPIASSAQRACMRSESGPLLRRTVEPRRRADRRSPRRLARASALGLRADGQARGDRGLDERGSRSSAVGRGAGDGLSAPLVASAGRAAPSSARRRASRCRPNRRGRSADAVGRRRTIENGRKSATSPLVTNGSRLRRP